MALTGGRRLCLISSVPTGLGVEMSSCEATAMIIRRICEYLQVVSGGVRTMNLRYCRGSLD